MVEWNNAQAAGEQQQNLSLLKEDLNSWLGPSCDLARFTRLQHRPDCPVWVKTWPHGMQVCCYEATKQLNAWFTPAAGASQGWCSPPLPQLPLGFISHLEKEQTLPLTIRSNQLYRVCGLTVGHQGYQFTVRIRSRYVCPPVPPPCRKWQPAEWGRRNQLWTVPGFGLPYTQYACAYMQHVQPEYTAFCSTDHTFACHYSAYK